MPNIFNENTHLFKDSFYPMSQHLLIPYKDFEQLTNRQRNFNVTHEKEECLLNKHLDY